MGGSRRDARAACSACSRLRCPGWRTSGIDGCVTVGDWRQRIPSSLRRVARKFRVHVGSNIQAVRVHPSILLFVFLSEL